MNLSLFGFKLRLPRLSLRGLAPAWSSAFGSPTAWIPLIREYRTGDWQRSITVTTEDSLGYWAVFRCIAIIAGDIAKMRIKLVEQASPSEVWREVSRPAVDAVLRKPNTWQTRIQFVESWMHSKLTRGNTYALKQRDPSGRIIGLTVLDPNRCLPLVSDDGQVFYQLHRDNLAGLGVDTVIVPASEIIHDRWNTIYHPLCGLSPLYACAINAGAGVKIQNATYKLYEQGGRPSGILTAPGAISDASAKRAKEYWDENYTGDNSGKVAVLGDGLKYEKITMSASDAQLIDQLKWGDVAIAGAFGVPAYMINAGTAPAYNNVEALNQQYYSQCLQVHIEAIELLLDEGLELTAAGAARLGTEFDLDALLRMDTATAIKSAVEGLKGIFTPNEARAKFDLAPIDGGDTVYMQQQNFSLAALAKRDALDDPFGKAAAPAPAASDPAADNDNADDEEAAKALAVIRLGLAA